MVKGWVIGTTGFDDAGNRLFARRRRKIAIVFAANFSVGVNASCLLLEKAAKVMGDYSDTAIEAHQRHKVMHCRVQRWQWARHRRALDKNLKDCAVYREGYTGERVPGTIGAFATVRRRHRRRTYRDVFADIGARRDYA